VGTPVTLYADDDGALSFYPSEGASPVPFELADGYRLEGGLVGGRVAIFGPPGKLGLQVDEALTAGVLKPVFDERLASVDDATASALGNLQNALASTGARLAAGDWVHFHEGKVDGNDRLFRHFGRPGQPCPYCEQGNKPTKVLTCLRVEAANVEWDVAEHVKGTIPMVTTKVKLDI